MAKKGMCWAQLLEVNPRQIHEHMNHKKPKNGLEAQEDYFSMKKANPLSGLACAERKPNLLELLSKIYK